MSSRQEAPLLNEYAERLAVLVKAAVEHGPEGWSAFLDEACRFDPAMRAKVEALLSHHERAGRFIEKPALRLAAEAVFRDGMLEASEAIGDYEIMSLIGSGGMGDVYLARDRQLHRQVALKLVRRGLDTGDLTRRFWREEQILASLNHPNIARLYGGGVTAEGVPYFVMEYVDGTRLDDYCHENKLSIRERLALFRKVCSAVAYAHQHLVIHRDIKPGNIRVTREGEPMLLDFGIAKLLDPADSLGGEQTMTFAAAMTPEYASPEQVRGEAIATTSDVYSLGVVLYKLLTGQSPYRTKTNRSNELARAITEREPTPPSIALKEQDSADSRFTESASPARTDSRLLRGDLDNIVLRAMRKEPERRYESAAQFSEDIRRYLDGLPVIARKDTWSYRSTKFINRNRIAVGAGALLLLALLGGVVATDWEARVAWHEKARAEMQRIKAEKRFNDVRRLANSFVFEVEPQIQKLPGATGARQTLVKRALEYLDSLSQEASDDRSLQHELARAYFEVGNIQGKPYLPNLGDTNGAIVSYRKAQAIFEALLATEPTDRTVQRDLAYTYQDLGNVIGEKTGDFASNLEIQRKAVAMFEAVATADPANTENQLNLVQGYNYLASVTMALGLLHQSTEQQEQALEYQRHAIVLVETLFSKDPANREIRRVLAASYLRMGIDLQELGERTAEMSKDRLALDYDIKAQNIFQSLSTADPTNTFHMRDAADAGLFVGRTRLSLGDTVGAVEIFRQITSTYKALVDADPLNRSARFELADAFNYTGQALAKNKDLNGALIYCRQAQAILRALSENHWERDNRIKLIQINEIIGGLLETIGDKEGAISNYREALAILDGFSATEPGNGASLQSTALEHANIARVYATIAADSSDQKQRDSWAEARACYQRSLKIWQELRAQNSLGPMDEKHYTEVIQEIKKCDVALAKQ